MQAAEGTGNEDPNVANMWHGILHQKYRILRTSESGRQGISAMINHGDPHVCCWAAAHSLEWDADAAKKSLESLRDAGEACAFDAEMILREHMKGRLTFNY